MTAAITQTEYTPRFQRGADRAFCARCNETHGGWMQGDAPDLWRCEYCSDQQHDDQMQDLREASKTATKAANRTIQRFERSVTAPARNAELDIVANNIRRELIAFRDHLKRSIVHIEAAGRFLNRAKQLIGHGNWGAWLDENFGMSEETATNFRHVASFRDQHPEIDLSEFAPTIVYKITAPSAPPDAVQKVLGLLTGGEKPKVKQVQAIIDQETLKTAPQIIQAAVEADELTVKAGAAITRALVKAPEIVQDVVQKFGVSDPAIIPALSAMAKRGSETLAVIAATGALQGGGEAVPLVKATIRDLEALLSENRHYKMLGDAPDYLVDASCKVVSAGAGRLILDASDEVIEQFQRLLSQNSGVLCRVTVKAAKEPIMNQLPSQVQS